MYCIVSNVLAFPRVVKRTGVTYAYLALILGLSIWSSTEIHVQHS